jgi:hypothetical protein
MYDFLHDPLSAAVKENLLLPSLVNIKSKVIEVKGKVIEVKGKVIY